MTITGVTNGVVSFSFTVNAGFPRTGHIYWFDQKIYVIQSSSTSFLYTLGTTNCLEGPQAGADSVVLAVTPNSLSWTNTANDAWLHLSAANQNGTGSTNIIFTYDANSGTTRSGTLTIAGQTLTVTQAGSTYVPAGTVITLASGFESACGVTVDGAGNVYTADFFANKIYKWTASNNTAADLISSGLDEPSGVALDSVGNLYITDYGDNKIFEWVEANNVLTTLISSGLNNPEGVGVDGPGNVYFTDDGSTTLNLQEWLVDSGNVITLVTNGLDQPNFLGLDVAGNVYIGDHFNSAIMKWTAATGSLSAIASNLNGVVGSAVDGAGNVYITDYPDSLIEKWTAASGTVTTLVYSGLDKPEGVAVDATGNIYIGDTYHGAIKELPFAFVDPTPRIEGTAAGSDSLPSVLPATENLLPPFAPTSDSPSWLTITGVTNGVVNFAFTATDTPRAGHITLLGQSIPIDQGVSLPAITSSPSNQTVVAGSTVTFNASATGTSPLTLQWLFDGTNIVGATNDSLTLTNVLAANAGSYWMVASDPFGSATSSVAVLTVNETTLQVVSTNAAGGEPVLVSVDMDALGTEAAVSFSLNFNPNLLTYQGGALGSGAAGGAWEVNTNQASAGVLGFEANLGLSTFAPGTDDVFDVTFQAAIETAPATANITFASTPIQQLVVATNVQILPAVYEAGSVAISVTALAGDVSPRPNGNEVVNLADWVQEGLFVAGLETVSNGSEFQRADCAPRLDPDGQITVADWVQVGRYAAGLDPLTAAAGPTNPVSDVRFSGKPGKLGLTRLITFLPVTQGLLTNSVAVQLTAHGDENSIGFSVNFDPTMIQFVKATLGSGASGATLVPNTTQAGNGVLGFVVGYYPPTTTFATGTQTLLNLTFASVTYSNTAPLAFTNSPVICQLVDTNTVVLPANFIGSSLSVGGATWPTLAYSLSGTNLVFSWPTGDPGFSLQAAASLDGVWTNVTGNLSTNGGNLEITTSISTNSQFFRLKY